MPDYNHDLTMAKLDAALTEVANLIDPLGVLDEQYASITLGSLDVRVTEWRRVQGAARAVDDGGTAKAGPPIAMEIIGKAIRADIRALLTEQSPQNQTQLINGLRAKGHRSRHAQVQLNKAELQGWFVIERGGHNAKLYRLASPDEPAEPAEPAPPTSLLAQCLANMGT